MTTVPVALATCAELPDLNPEDRPLLSALEERNVHARPVVWDDTDVDWSDFGAVVIRSTWDYASRREHFLDWAEAVGSAVPLFNDAGTVAWSTDKSYLRELEAAGVPIVPTVWLPRGASPQLPALLAAHGWADAVVKPAVSAGGHGVARVRRTAGQAELEAASATVARALEGGDVMVQPYLAAVEGCGELSLVFIDGSLTHAVRKRPAAGDFRVQERFGGSVAADRASPAEQAVAAAALSACGRDPLYARVDLLPSGDGPLVVEAELAEPGLFLTSAPATAGILADALIRRLQEHR